MADHVEAYLRDLYEIHSSHAAVPETSYYPALATLLSQVGKSLKPRVRCIVNPKNRGAGIPDGGLFTSDQFARTGGVEPAIGLMPSRGAVEVKGASEDACAVARGDQVARYCERYGQVLVTNLRDYLLVVWDGGRPVVQEHCSLAEDEFTFWSAVAHPRRTAALLGERFSEFLKRAMLRPAPLASPQDLAWFLASCARDARVRIEGVDLPALAALRTALERALGIQFNEPHGEHFFRSTLVQTLFYGVFSAWVLWAKDHPTGRFDWQKASWSLKVPMIRALFAQVAMPDRLEPLGLVEVLDWAGAALNRVDRDAFFGRFEEADAVQYFYEPFLQEFDPELRKEMGVWYTPREVVRYMVARVDAVLRSDLGIEDGFADPRVLVLDPCCGTGAFLVEVLNRVAATLKEKGEDALVADDLKQAAMERVFGFEILPAPFVVAHLQLGLLLQRLGTPLASGKGERAGVYLTNALTGWEPPDPVKEKLVQLSLTGMPELVQERDAADKVKRAAEILVILGNPPYNGYAGMAMEEERDLSNSYRSTRRAAAPQGQGLNDLYVRFYRMAERRIVEQTGRGIVCFISNYSWLDGLSFTGMRERYLEAFDGIWVDCLNGDKYKTGKLTPEGEPDPSIFSTEFNPEGIQVGTAIALLARRGQTRGTEGVHFRHLWGKGKRAELLQTADQQGGDIYQSVAPPLELGLPFLPTQFAADYVRWPLLTDLFLTSFPGVKTSRDDVVVDIDRERLVERMRCYFDPNVSHEEMARISPGSMEDTCGFDARATRDYLRKRGFLEDRVVRYCYRPFDVRWLYWEPETKLLDRNRAEYFSHVSIGNLWLASTTRSRKLAFYQPQVTTVLADMNVIEANVQMFPLHLSSDLKQADLFGQERSALIPNFSQSACEYLGHSGATSENLFFHIVGLLHSTRYRDENAGALRQDWPRVPLPAGRDTLVASSGLGMRVGALLDPLAPVDGVTAGLIRRELSMMATPSRATGTALDPSRGDLRLTAGWGFAGKDGATMAGQGRVVVRGYSPEESAAIEEGAKALGLSLAEALQQLGDDTRDVYLNDVAYWKNVPASVWGYTIGGYQVLKKWLSYREYELLGRALSKDEVRLVREIARRIAAILLLGPQLDTNYQAVKADGYAWPARQSPGWDSNGGTGL
ncbi:MAG: type ISP restriction/modification enzyme [Chloroflexota bacterium]